MTTEFGPWGPLSIDEVVTLMSTTGMRWWFTGGHALEMDLERSWRDHDDIDVGVCRVDLDALVPLLGEWEIHVAAAGVVRRWDGSELAAERHENNLWFKRPNGPWCLDMVIGDGNEDSWAFRRDPTLRLAWNIAVCSTAGGIEYLTPALQLLFKSKGLRPKDHVDAAEVFPELDEWGIALLDVRLRGDHPWRPLIDAHRQEFAAADVIDVLDTLSAAGVDAWVDGGWGVDALLGEQTCAHADLDLALPTRQWALVHEALHAQSFAVVRGDGTHNVLLLDRRGRLVDLHAFDDTATVVGNDGIEYHGPDGLAYEAGGFDGVGTIAGRSVACMSATFQVRSHTGCDIQDDDWHDVRRLHERFGLPIPLDYGRWTTAPENGS